MKVITVEQMKELDRRSIEEHDIPSEVLMENAGTKAARLAERMIDEHTLKEKALLFAGKGKNGGDAFVAARVLIEDSIQATTVLLCDEEEIKGDAKANLDRLLSANGHVIRVTKEEELEYIKGDLYGTDLIIDGILGTGIKRPVAGYLATVIEMINESGKMVLSIDIPSGLNGNTGHAPGACVVADQTLTMGLPKIGMLAAEGLNYSGKIHIGKIGIPDPLLDEVKADVKLLLSKDLHGILPRRRKHLTHKGDYGKVLIASGSVGHTGAASLAATASLRGGSGLVTLAIPESLNDILEHKVTEVVTVPLPETKERTFSAQAVKPLLSLEKQCDVWVIGPGISTHPETEKFLVQLLPKITKPAVLDADALNILAKNKELLKKVKAPLVLTPHEGEMARLLGKTPASIQKNRWESARAFAKEHKVVLVLKGAGTVVADPKGNIFINSTGNPGMATAGSGDILAGLIGSFLGQDLSPLDAAKLGVVLHGEAGDLAAEEVGEPSLMSGDLLWSLPRAIVEFIS